MNRDEEVEDPRLKVKSYNFWILKVFKRSSSMVDQRICMSIKNMSLTTFPYICFVVGGSSVVPVAGTPKTGIAVLNGARRQVRVTRGGQP